MDLPSLFTFVGKTLVLVQSEWTFFARRAEGRWTEHKQGDRSWSSSTSTKLMWALGATCNTLGFVGSSLLLPPTRLTSLLKHATFHLPSHSGSLISRRKT